ncbi:MAG: thioredoxin family protein [Pontimonas sp.]
MGAQTGKKAAERLATLASERADINVALQRVENEAHALACDFRGLPTFLLEGQPLFPVPDSPPGPSCRLYSTPEGLVGSPTLEQLRDAITYAANTLQ